MEQKVLQWIKQNDLIPKNSNVAVGVSGGPDSLSLLHFLHHYRKQLNIKVSAITIDHQLRSDISLEDVKFVEAFCEALNIPCYSRSVSVPKYQKKHALGTQMAARALRYQAFAEVMQEQNMSKLALGHHADDQIETVVMQVTKTTNLHNLTGIPVRRPLPFGEVVRPFLSITKQDIYRYGKKHNLTFRFDESNLEHTYMRNRIRQEVIPALEEENPNLATTMLQLVQHLKEDESFMMNEAKRLFTELIQTDASSGEVRFSAQQFSAYPVSLQRRLYRITLDYLYEVIPEQITYKQEKSFLDLLIQTGQKQLDFPGGCRIYKTYDEVVCTFSDNEVEMETPAEKLIHEVPNQVKLPNGDLLFVRELTDSMVQKAPESPHLFILPESFIKFPLTVRTRCPGDRMRYEGLEGSKKIKDIFIDEKVTQRRRKQWPILTNQSGTILWVVGLRKFPFQYANDGRYLLFEYKEQDV